MGNVAVKWAGEGSQLFLGRDSFGHVVASGSWREDDPDWQEWKAMKPSDLLMVSLASCSAHDVVMILGRQRQNLTNLYVSVDGTQAVNPPYQFTDIHLHYVVEGTDLDERKVARAIQLSEERYCSVSNTIRGVANITSSIELRQAVE
jgi:putative redox protein